MLGSPSNCDFQEQRTSKSLNYKTDVIKHILIPDATHPLAFNISVASRFLANCFTRSPVFSHNYRLSGGCNGSHYFLFY